MAAVEKIAACLAQGAPADWRRLVMVVDLAMPGAAAGDVRYLATREGTPDQFEPFTPCDVRMPAQTLLEARKSQAAGRERWTGARITLLRDGSFQLQYDYPK
jgi:hypothetical protein